MQCSAGAYRSNLQGMCAGVLYAPRTLVSGRAAAVQPAEPLSAARFVSAAQLLVEPGGARGPRQRVFAEQVEAAEPQGAATRAQHAAHERAPGTPATGPLREPPPWPRVRLQAAAVTCPSRARVWSCGGAPQHGGQVARFHPPV